MDYEVLRDDLISFYKLRDAGCGNVRFNFYNVETGVYDREPVDGIIEVYEEFLLAVQRKCIYRAVCRHCRPRGFSRNLFRYAKHFAEEAVKEISVLDLFYEIDFYYTKDHCPYVVEFEI